jgi:hypothetical protein
MEVAKGKEGVIRGCEVGMYLARPRKLPCDRRHDCRYNISRDALYTWLRLRDGVKTGTDTRRTSSRKSGTSRER